MVAVHDTALATITSGKINLWDVRQEGTPAPVGSLPLAGAVEASGVFGTMWTAVFRDDDVVAVGDAGGQVT